MRVIKAFTLIELLIVIILIGILLSFVLANYTSEKSLFGKNHSTLSQLLKSFGDDFKGFYYIVGDKCNKSIILNDNKSVIKKTNIFKKKFEVYFRENMGNIEVKNFDDMVYKGIRYHVCLKLKIKNGRFLDKFIVATSGKFLLFDPFFQDTKVFSDFERVKNAYFQKNLIPKSIDDYYQR